MSSSQEIALCAICYETELSPRNSDGLICHVCFEARRERLCRENSFPYIKKEEPTKRCSKEEPVTPNECKANSMSTPDEKRLRKSTRSTRSKVKSSSQTTPLSSGTSSKAQSKGRNRRNLFKSQKPVKSLPTQATTKVVDSVFYKSTYMQVGDIVSLVDGEDNVYYAQIRGLLVDNYCEKSAFLTWLIPTQSSPDPRDGFDPATYLIGPDEELSRKLTFLEFVMHAPSNYYLDRTKPFPLPDDMDNDPSKRAGFIWTVLPEYRRGKSKK